MTILNKNKASHSLTQNPIIVLVFVLFISFPLLRDIYRNTLILEKSILQEFSVLFFIGFIFVYSLFPFRIVLNESEIRIIYPLLCFWKNKKIPLSKIKSCDIIAANKETRFVIHSKRKIRTFWLIATTPKSNWNFLNALGQTDNFSGKVRNIQLNWEWKRILKEEKKERENSKLKK